MRFSEPRDGFRRHFYQHAGFRYITSDAAVEIPDDTYETDPEVIPYCELHYGDDCSGRQLSREIGPNRPQLRSR